MVTEHVAAPLSRQRYEHGEGIRYDAAAGELLWVDIGAGRLMRAAPDSVDDPTVSDAGRPVGAVAPRAAGGWLLAAGRGFAVLGGDGALTPIAEVEPDGNRMNDGACDARGRFWAGSMAYDEHAGAGSLHRLELDGSVDTMLTGLTISNGIGWSPDGATMYLNDSGPGVTYAFDVDADTGDIDRQRVLIRYDDGVGDGLAIDADGHLWVPLWGGNAVHRYDPAGRLVATVAVSAAHVSCCCLANGSLYITTAYKGLDNPGPDDGRLFVADVGVDGPPVAVYRGDVPG